MLKSSDEFVLQQPVKILKNNLGKWDIADRDAFDDNLLRLVFHRPPLFNYSLPMEERTASICTRLWKEVTDELIPKYGPLDVERIKHVYKYHRNRFTRYRSAVSKMKDEISSRAPVKIYTPKHMEILCKIDALIEDSKTNSVNTTNPNPSTSNTCRTCLIEKLDMESIFSMQLVNNEFVKISKMVSMCTGLEFSEYDNVSNVICDSCINAVSLAFEFRSKCWESHNILLDKMLQATKQRAIIKPKTPSFINHEFLMQNVLKDSTRRATKKPKRQPVKTQKIIKFINKSEIIEKLKEHADITLDNSVYRGKRYKCRHCEQKYLAAHLMIDHLENIHKFSIKPDNQYNRLHVRKHKEVKVICQQCGVSVAKGRFAEHFRRHTGEKPFKCDSCDFRTAQISSLTKHKLTHTGEKPALCHVCGRGFRTASHRAVHMRSHSNEKPFKCIICTKGFKLNEFLKRHMQIHEPSAMFECEICKRKFSQKGPHRVHMMQHTGRRPHKCSECGKGFIQRHCWRTHMKNHHKITVQ